MTQWQWLEKPEKSYSWLFAVRVVVKAVILFVLVNVVFALVNPLPNLGGLSLYNTVIPGHERLPYGENPAESYNLSLFNIPAMFASHNVGTGKDDNEYRVLVVGDSATWGWLLENDETLSGVLNDENLTTDDGREIVFYNIGYPIMSLTKDLILMDHALQYEPDMVVWLITLESMPRDKQLFPPLVQNNPDAVREMINAVGLDLDPNDSRFVEPDFMESTLYGQRRSLADLLRLQVYGFSWAATGIDQYWDGFDPLTRDFGEDVSWEGFDAPQDFSDDQMTQALAFDVLAGGIERVRQTDDNIPVVIVNEPIFISDGENSDLHYNIWYPRWIYDQYRAFLTDVASLSGWHFVDAWDTVAPEAFTDSPVHTTPAGVHQLAETLMPELLTIVNASE